MKLGKDTNSLINYLIANPNYVEPKVGMDVTECHWTDRTAYRIIDVDKDLKGFTMQKYDPRNEGDVFNQKWVYDNEDGTPRLTKGHTVHIRFKYNKWKIDGIYNINLAFNTRDEYYDPSF